MCVLSNHQLPKACVFGYKVLSDVNDRKGAKVLLAAQAEELPHHLLHQSHNTHSVGEGVQLRQLHETIVRQSIERPAQSMVDPMHE